MTHLIAQKQPPQAPAKTKRKAAPKLSPDEVTRARDLRAQGMSFAEIARLLERSEVAIRYTTGFPEKPTA